MEQEGLWTNDPTINGPLCHIGYCNCTCAGNYYFAYCFPLELRTKKLRQDEVRSMSMPIQYGTVVVIMHATFTSFRKSERRIAGSPSINCTAVAYRKRDGGGDPGKLPSPCAIAAKPKNWFACLFVCLSFLFVFAHLLKQTIAGKAAVAARVRVYSSKRLHHHHCAPCESRGQKQLTASTVLQ
jgi:hypothetical protein